MRSGWSERSRRHTGEPSYIGSRPKLLPSSLTPLPLLTPTPALTLCGMAERVVSLIDVDNTLLDNDAAKVEIGRRLLALLGEAGTAAFWVAYEVVRADLGVVDIPRAIHQALP